MLEQHYVSNPKFPKFKPKNWLTPFASSFRQLKNLAIGSNRQKENVINANIVPRLLQLLIEEIQNEQLLYEIGKCGRDTLLARHEPRTQVPV